MPHPVNQHVGDILTVYLVCFPLVPESFLQDGKPRLIGDAFQVCDSGFCDAVPLAIGLVCSVYYIGKAIVEYILKRKELKREVIHDNNNEMRSK